VTHEISLAVWDAPSPVVIGRRATVKVGIACPSGCSLTGATIEIRDEMGAIVGSGGAGCEPWPGTTALHWVELDVTAPDSEGDHAWSIHGAPRDAAHEPATTIVRIVVSRSPEHRVTVEVVEQGSGRPLAGVELRVGPYRTVTDDVGIASLDVPGGSYDVCAWKTGHDLVTTTTQVAGNMTLPLAVAVTLSPEQPYWM
jgi:hypothetical protein